MEGGGTDTNSGKAGIAQCSGHGRQTGLPHMPDACSEMEPLGTWKSTRTEGRRLPENVDDFTELEFRAHVEHDTRVRRVISAAHRAPLRVYRLRG